MRPSFMADGQKWRLVDDPKFTAGKKLKKKELEEKLAHTNRWPMA